jgi:hypothetical protein
MSLKGAQSIRDLQVASLSQLLNFNTEASPSALSTWKVLVLDSRAQDVLATTLRVSDLRDNGVTLHMHAPALRMGSPG